MIGGAAREIDDGHQGRASNRRSAAHDAGVGQQDADGGDHRRATEAAGQPEGRQQQCCQDGDVATRNGDDVIRAGFL
jgi:hypothetical protein